MGLTFSRRLALLGGILVPLAELARRSHQLGDLHALPFWLDDILIGALLLYGGWQTSRDTKRGLPSLAAAWGFACGLGYASFFSQLAALDTADPSGLTPALIVCIKGTMLTLAIVALIVTLRHQPLARPQEVVRL